MADPARPALAEVLAALTDIPVKVMSLAIFPDGQARPAHRRRRVRVDEFGLVIEMSPAVWDPPAPAFAALDLSFSWTTRDPAEAWEILDARGLLPPEGARGFWCTPCDSARGERGFMGCPVCALTGNRRTPATIPDLVAWASLGAEAIVTAEALAVEACRDLRECGVEPCERVVWRVSDRGVT